MAARGSTTSPRTRSWSGCSRCLLCTTLPAMRCTRSPRCRIRWLPRIDVRTELANTCVVSTDRGVRMNAPKLNPARERHWVCARRLRERRLALGLTQREVVARLGHQTTNRALSVMENGRALDLGLLPDLATALECTVTHLLGLTDDPSAWQPA